MGVGFYLAIAVIKGKLPPFRLRRRFRPNRYRYHQYDLGGTPYDHSRRIRSPPRPALELGYIKQGYVVWGALIKNGQYRDRLLQYCPEYAFYQRHPSVPLGLLERCLFIALWTSICMDVHSSKDRSFNNSAVVISV